MPCLTGTDAPQARGARLSARSTAALAKGTFVVFGATSGQASWDVANRFGLSVEWALPTPCLSLSPASSSHPGHSAEGLMPKAARERVASPPAGTTLVPRTRACRLQRVRLMGEVRLCV